MKTKLDLENELKWNEGKSYNWCVLLHDNLTMVIRAYHSHFTIMTCLSTEHTKRDYTWTEKKYGAFTFHIESDKIKTEEICEEAKKYTYPVDYYNCDNIFHDINNMIFPIIDLIKNSNFHLLWNSVSLPRPNHVEIKIAFHNESINSIDLTMFVGEEISNQHLELYAENDMFDMVKEIAKIKPLPDSIKSVYPIIKNEYYHDVGIDFKTGSYMKDVYCLTRYHHDEVLALLPKKEVE